MPRDGYGFTFVLALIITTALFAFVYYSFLVAE